MLSGSSGETYAIFGRTYADYISFSAKIARAFADSYAAMTSTYLQESASSPSSSPDAPPTELERKMMAKARETFESRFRDQDFLKSMSEFIEAYSKLAKDTGFGQIYQSASNWWRSGIIYSSSLSAIEYLELHRTRYIQKAVSACFITMMTA